MCSPSTIVGPGIGVGLAAGIKLTPAFFLLLFFVQGNFRAIGIALVVFIITVILGFLAVQDAGAFWTSAMFNSSRVGEHEDPVAQSIRSVLIRVFDNDSTALWLVLAIAITVLVAMAVGVALIRGNKTLALALTGIGAYLVSPFSWYHHWVWVIPFAIALLAFIAERFEHKGFWWAPAGTLVGLVAGEVILLPSGSFALLPYFPILNTFHQYDTLFGQLAFIGFGFLYIVAYLIYARRSIHDAWNHLVNSLANFPKGAGVAPKGSAQLEASNSKTSQSEAAQHEAARQETL